MQTHPLRSCAALVAYVLMTATTALAQESKPTGYIDAQRDPAMAERMKARAKIEFPEALRPIVEAKEAAHVANAVALRDRQRGYIHLRGVPPKSEIVRSLIFANLSDDKAKGDDTLPMLLDGNLVIAKKIADNTDPCWNHAGNHSYLADVTAFTNQSGGPNQEYELTLPFAERSSTAGQNPWQNLGASSPVLLEGATLIVLYRNAETTGMVYVYAPPGDNMFTAAASYALVSPGLGAGTFTMIGADGQRGLGHDNVASNELSFFDGAQIAGPPIAASDWDGSAGWPLPQLWDTHTHEVRIGNAVSRVEYRAGADCLVPVGFVLDQL